MIIYVESSAFPYKSFVTVVKPGDRIARIRAQMMHILLEIGREDNQFRLRYNGQFLRDAFTLEDYQLEPSCVIKMVPLSSRDSLSDLRSVTSSMTSSLDSDSGKMSSVKSALYQEVSHLNWRQDMIRDVRVLLYIQTLMTCLTILTNYTYSVFWFLAYVIVGLYLVPGYTRIGGYIGNTFHIRYVFALLQGILSAILVAVSIYITVIGWRALAAHGCGEFENDCSYKAIYTASFFTVHAVVSLTVLVYCVLLFFNFRIEVGDLIEKSLVQERDIEEVMRAARSNKVKERRTAAYEMATMAASSDDNKFRIVAEGGLNVLIPMSLSNDESTQEYAVEALSELITIQSIQDNYVEMGGVRKMTALLHSPNARVMQEAARALYTICQSDENRHAMVEDHGLSDLAHAARNGSIETQRLVASIFLELVFNSDIRAQLTTRNIPAQALVQLCHSNDPETLRFTLLTLELLAIESSDVVCAQEELLGLLLDLPLRMMDMKLNLLAGKILLYFAENPQSREQMMSSPGLKESLRQFAQTQDAILQKVVVKIIFCMMETTELKLKARALRLNQVLAYVLDKAADRDVWDMADQGLQEFQIEERDLPTLPELSTLEKLTMGSKDSFGSRESLRSNLSLGSSGASGNYRG